jgi:tight adherence protein C
VVLGNEQILSMLTFLGVFLGICGLMVAVSFWLNADHRQAVARLRGLSARAEEPAHAKSGLAQTALPKVGALLSRGSSEQQARLRKRLAQAGFYGAQAAPMFLGTTLVLAVVLPILGAGCPYLAGLLPAKYVLAAAAAAGCLGVILPGLFVDFLRRRRLSQLRQGVPDAVDMLVLCVEGGIGLTSGLQRVTGELRVAHPLLGAEMEITQREIQLGLSAGEAVQKLGDRCEVDELRQLGSLLMQSERFGTSVVKSLRIHAETCRQERQQRAEEVAQKAAVKILFPTLLCIFPAIFVVILGPAAYQIAEMFKTK